MVASIFGDSVNFEIIPECHWVVSPGHFVSVCSKRTAKEKGGESRTVTAKEKAHPNKVWHMAAGSETLGGKRSAVQKVHASPPFQIYVEQQLGLDDKLHRVIFKFRARQVC